MLRNVLCAVAVLGLSLGLATSAEIKGRITKIDGNKITVDTGKKGESDEKVFEADKDVKVSKKTEDGKEALSGLSAITTGKKGVGAVLTTNADNKVTAITLVARKKKT